MLALNIARMEGRDPENHAPSVTSRSAQYIEGLLRQLTIYTTFLTMPQNLIPYQGTAVARPLFSTRHMDPVFHQPGCNQANGPQEWERVSRARNPAAMTPATFDAWLHDSRAERREDQKNEGRIWFSSSR